MLYYKINSNILSGNQFLTVFNDKVFVSRNYGDNDKSQLWNLLNVIQNKSGSMGFLLYNKLVNKIVYANDSDGKELFLAPLGSGGGHSRDNCIWEYSDFALRLAANRDRNMNVLGNNYGDINHVGTWKWEKGKDNESWQFTEVRLDD